MKIYRRFSSVRSRCGSAGLSPTRPRDQHRHPKIVERLTRKHPAVPRPTVADVVEKMHAKFDGRPVRDFVPLFVERNANAELAKLVG